MVRIHSSGPCLNGLMLVAEWFKASSVWTEGEIPMGSNPIQHQVVHRFKGGVAKSGLRQQVLILSFSGSNPDAPSISCNTA